mgnify:CR=1 FL=1
MKNPCVLIAVAIAVTAVFAACAGRVDADVNWTPDKGWQRTDPTGGKGSDTFDKAFGMYVAGRFSRARHLLEKYIETGQEGVVEQARLLIAECYLGEKHYTKSFVKFEEFIDAYPVSVYIDRAFRGEVEIAQAVLSGARIRALGLRIWSGYSFGEKVVDKITERRPLSDCAGDAQLALARCYFRRGLYGDSATAFQQYVEIFGESEDAPEALLGAGKSLYLDAPGPGYDPLRYYRAEAASRDFIGQYGSSRDRREADSLSREAREKLAEHYLMVGKYYLKKGKLDAAGIYFKKVVTEYGQTGTAAKAQPYLNALSVQQ